MSTRSSRSYGEGTVIERKRKSGVFFPIRFNADGEREWENLGSAATGWTRKRAEARLRKRLVEVADGVWVNPRNVKPEPEPVPTFHAAASEWLRDQKVTGGRRGSGLSEAGYADLEWRLAVHLLPYFAPKPIDEITIADVDAYKTAKMRRNQEIRDAEAAGNPIMVEYTDRRGCRHRRAARPLSNTSINKTLATLAAILDVAVERELITRNPATVGGKRRRLPGVRPPRIWLPRVEHIKALLDGASKLDEEAMVRRGQRRALLAVLVYGGLRISEALALRWRDVNLADKIKVPGTETDTAVRTVRVLPVLRDELDRFPAPVDAPDALVFGTSTGRRMGATNVRRRILAPAVELANEQLAKDGADPMPEGLTPHSLRRTFASLLFAIDTPLPRAMQMMGRRTASLTLEVYARPMDDDDGELEGLQALVNGGDEWAQQPAPVAADSHPAVTRAALDVEAARP